MTMSVDGRQLVDRWTAPVDGVDKSQLVRHHYDEVAARFSADGWIVGRVTMEEFTHGTARLTSLPADEAALRDTHFGVRDGRDVAVAIAPAGKLHYGQDHAAGHHIIAVLGEQVSAAYLAELRRDGVSYLFAGPDGRDLTAALHTLGADSGLRTLLLEGGRAHQRRFPRGRSNR